MAVTIPVGYGQASLLFALDGKPDEMVITCGVSTTAAPGLIAAAWFHAWTDPGSVFTTTSMFAPWSVRGARVTWMDVTGPLLTEHIETVLGAAGAELLPPNCAFLVRKRTSRGGRKGRGRFFFPPAIRPEGNVSPYGFFDGAWVAAINTKLETVRAGLVSSGIVPVLLHEDGSTPDNITSFRMETQIATQRRRMR